MTRKIAIVGSAGTKQYAPWNDRSWELWSLNHKYWNYDRTDRHFDIHNPVNIRKNKAYLNWLVGLQEKVMLAAPMPEMPRAMIFPQKEIMERFGDYFNNSISWMIALALYEGVDEIGVYGVELTQKIEYERQRPSVLHLLGIAKGMGVKVTTPSESRLLAVEGFYWWVST